MFFGVTATAIIVAVALWLAITGGQFLGPTSAEHALPKQGDAKVAQKTEVVKATAAGDKIVTEGEPIADVTSFAFLDEVAIRRKNGRAENYGLDLWQHQSGPITVKETELILTASTAILA